MCKQRRHARDCGGKARYQSEIEVLQLKVVSRHLGRENAVLVDGIELQANLLASLTEWVFGGGLPKSRAGNGFVVEAGEQRVVDFASDDSDFVYLLGNEMVDAVPQLRR